MCSMMCTKKLERHEGHEGVCALRCAVWCELWCELWCGVWIIRPQVTMCSMMCTMSPKTSLMSRTTLDITSAKCRGVTLYAVDYLSPSAGNEWKSLVHPTLFRKAAPRCLALNQTAPRCVAWTLMCCVLAFRNIHFDFLFVVGAISEFLSMQKSYCTL